VVFLSSKARLIKLYRFIAFLVLTVISKWSNLILRFYQCGKSAFIATLINQNYFVTLKCFHLSSLPLIVNFFSISRWEVLTRLFKIHIRILSTFDIKQVEQLFLLLWSHWSLLWWLDFSNILFSLFGNLLYYSPVNMAYLLVLVGHLNWRCITLVLKKVIKTLLGLLPYICSRFPRIGLNFFLKRAWSSFCLFGLDHSIQFRLW
jgi:hypothetical protein